MRHKICHHIYGSAIRDMRSNATEKMGCKTDVFAVKDGELDRTVEIVTSGSERIGLRGIG